MKQIIKPIIAGIAGLALLVESSVIGDMSKSNNSLRNELRNTETKLQVRSQERDNYRRQLIKNGNPEGWTLNGDAIGNAWYEKLNGDGLGGSWKEYLEYQ